MKDEVNFSIEVDVDYHDGVFSNMRVMDTDHDISFAIPKKGTNEYNHMVKHWNDGGSEFSTILIIEVAFTERDPYVGIMESYYEIEQAFLKEGNELRDISEILFIDEIEDMIRDEIDSRTNEY